MAGHSSRGVPQDVCGSFSVLKFKNNRLHLQLAGGDVTLRKQDRNK